MLTRYILKDLIAWATSPQRKPLIIRGARQVGKSTVVHMLADAIGLDCVVLDLERMPGLAELFKSNDPSRIIQLIALSLKRPVTAGKTLLFLDEIQAAPEVMACLRYFYEELPELHIICAGSLLEFALEEHAFSMPVGRIEYYYLGPLGFDEFLLALGEEGLLEFISVFQIGEDFPLLVHQRLMDVLKLYWMVGGMPEAVQAYVTHRDFMVVEKSKRSILETYQDDFAKYASGKHAHLLRAVFEKIPRLIAQRLKYSEINANLKSTVIANALRQLSMAKIITTVYHSAANGVPLGAQINEKIFKLIFLDCGLLSTQLGLSYLDVHDVAELNVVNGGVMAEQFIGQHLLFMRPCFEPPHVYYWAREKKSSHAEVDYVITYRQAVIPVEVKAGKTGTLRSMHVFMCEKALDVGVKFSSQFPSSFTDPEGRTILSIPLYMVTQLERLLMR